MKKNIANAGLVVLLAGAMLGMAPVLHLLFFEAFIEGVTFSVYWGWFNWSTILEWIPRLLVGFIAGAAVTLLVLGTKPRYWALSVGILMAVTSVLLTNSHWSAEAPQTMRVFHSLWPLMYVVGAYGGSFTVSMVKHQLTRRSTGRALRRAG